MDFKIIQIIAKIAIYRLKQITVGWKQILPKKNISPANMHTDHWI